MRREYTYMKSSGDILMTYLNLNSLMQQHINKYN
jgi:hypothetical protein